METATTQPTVRMDSAEDIALADKMNAGKQRSAEIAPPVSEPLREEARSEAASKTSFLP